MCDVCTRVQLPPKEKHGPSTLHQKGVQPSRANLEYCFCLFLKRDGGGNEVVSGTGG